jgi:hypothetical protein
MNFAVISVYRDSPATEAPMPEGFSKSLGMNNAPANGNSWLIRRKRIVD